MIKKDAKQRNDIRKYIKTALSGNGITLSALYMLPDEDRICYGIALESTENPGIEPSDIRKHLKNDMYNFSVPNTFIRASSAFLHMEIDVTIL